MRVLLVSDAYPPIIGGATRAAQQLGRQLRRRGHAVSVATAWQRDLPAQEDDEGVRVHRLRGLVSRVGALSADPVRYTPPPFPDPELVWRVRRLVRSFRPDVVHSYGWLTYSVVPAMVGSPIPLILAAREYANVCAVRTLVRQGRERGTICSGPAWGKCHECAHAFYGEPKAAVAATAVLGGRRPLRRGISAVHSTSSYTAGIMREHLLGPRSMSHRVIPDFREDELTGPPDPEILSQLPAERYILFVGAFRRIKGDQILLDAYAQLEDPPPLVMIGARSADALPTFPSGVQPLFDVPHDTVMGAWDRALFGVMPSVVPEALGNVVHEAMSRARTVIGTRPGGHEDIIEHGRSGLLVPSGDGEALVAAMRQLIADPGRCRRMGAAAQARAERFRDAEVVPLYESLYADTIRAAEASKSR